ncbi:MAG: hypothetical protein LR015_03580 [Verrucomicrobia bacterium]|nr:hypothetical protein [Verrucomicrobiota bacterium]
MLNSEDQETNTAQWHDGIEVPNLPAKCRSHLTIAQGSDHQTATAKEEHMDKKSDACEFTDDGCQSAGIGVEFANQIVKA